MGEVFAGRYELLDLIGEGGMGSVWRVWDARTERVVAAKVLKQSDASMLLRFVREQAVRIHHPNVVVPLGWAGEDDRVLFTMPIIRGGSVANLVADHGPLPPKLVAEVLRQVLSGLTAVHAADLVHRDIKPANILLDATGTGQPHAYLSDFGIAVDLRAPRWTATGVVSGTPGYLAPEVESSGEVTFAADLYAAGQVAQTMLSGARPVERGASLLRPVDVPESLWSVVSSLVAAAPAGRPVSAQAALAALQSPDLAWHPEGIGDVEVFDQLPPDEPRPVAAGFVRRAGDVVVDAADKAEPVADPVAGRATDADSDRTVARTPVRTPVLTSAATRETARDGRAAGVPLAPGDGARPAQGAGSGSPSWARTAVLGPAAAVVALVGGLLIWSPWDGSPGSGSGPRRPTSSTTPSGGTSSSPSPSVATPPSTPSSTSSSQTTGSVTINPVIVRVGQPCEFTDVGQRGRTTGCVEVACTYDAGTYTWQRP